jgi:phospholipid/cholesterol/gamma-HCH transport system substrate-binding protein
MAMRTKIRAQWARIRVFFTLVVALAILFTLVYLLSGGGLLRTKTALYTYFEDSGGMEKDTPVVYNGVKIGKVSQVQLSHLSDPRRAVVVRMAVDERFLSQIPSDSKSEIVVENFLGDKIVQINRGQSPTPVVAGGELEHKPATNVYIRIDLATFAAQLRLIDATLKDIQEGKSDIGQFVMTDKLYQDLLNGVKNIEKQIATLADTKSTLGGLLYGKDLHDNIGATFRQLDKTLAEIQSGRGATGKLVRDPAQYDDLRKTLADIRRQIRDIGNTEFMKSDAAYQTWNKNLVETGRSIDAFNSTPLMASPQLYESLLGSSQQMGASLKDFRTNPKKYLRLKIF